MHRTGKTTLRWVVTASALAVVICVAAAILLQLLRPRVIVTETVVGPVVQAFYCTGTVQPEREYPIKSNIAGTVTEMRVDKGTRVIKGQPLAIVTDPALVFAAQKAQAELTEKLARADSASSPVLQEFDSRIAAMADLLEIARREQTRVSGMMEHNAGSQSDLDQAMDRVKTYWSQAESLKSQKQTMRLQLQREVDIAQAALADARWNLDQQTLRSPIDGVVLDRPVSLGTRLAINDALMRIADVSAKNLVMRAAVDEEDVAKATVGQVVRMTLYAFSGQTFRGVVDKIYDQADPDRRTFEVDVRLDGTNDRLSPGMTGELAFIMAEREKATLIPTQSVQAGKVYVVKNGRIARREPAIGIRSIERAEVISGIDPGERVVISPATDLADGQAVRTEVMDPVAAAGLNKPAASDGFKGFNGS